MLNYTGFFLPGAICHAQIITTVAGNGTLGYTGDDGPATSAQLNYCPSVAVDTNMNIYVGSANFVIRKVDAAGIIHPFAGSAISGYSGDGGPATNAKLRYTGNIVPDKRGNVFFLDANNNRIRKVNTSGIISTVAGNGSAAHSGDGGPATVAGVPGGGGVGTICVDDTGNIYVFSLGQIRRIDTFGIIHHVAGSMPGFSGDGGLADTAKVGNEGKLVVDLLGNLLIGDNGRIRKIDFSTRLINTIAGTGGATLSGDGGPSTAAGIAPDGLSMDECGNLFMCSGGLNRVRMINTAGIISTIAGTGVAGYTGDGGPATAATLHENHSSCTDKFGNVYVADHMNHAVRRINMKPTAAITGADTVCKGTAVTLTGTSSGGTWYGSNSSATVVGGVVTGISAGIDTIMYVVQFGCARDTARFPVRVSTAKGCHVGVTDESAARLQIYPNPATTEISITNPGNNADRYSIINSNGAHIAEGNMANAAQQVSIGGLAPGSYIVNLYKAGNVVGRKLFVKK